jgi:hypothetical protein
MKNNLGRFAGAVVLGAGLTVAQSAAVPMDARADEATAYDAALRAGDARSVADFVIAHPDSALIPCVFAAVPRRVAFGAVDLIPERTARRIDLKSVCERTPSVASAIAEGASLTDAGVMLRIAAIETVPRESRGGY